MEKLPAITGWIWIKQGFALFRKQPGGLSTLFLGYMFLMLFAGFLPFFGQFLPIVLVPVFSVAFMQACVHIENGKRVFPNLLISGFRKPVFPSLFALGLLYLLMLAFAIGLASLADDGVLWRVLNGLDIQSEEVRDSNISTAILLTVILYIPGAMSFCFAAPLIYWHKMSVGKAVFFSFFGVLRLIKAFIVFALAWFAISIICTKIVLIVFGQSELAMTVMFPLSIVLTVIMHCSFYASYKQVFGAPDKVSLDKAS